MFHSYDESVCERFERMESAIVLLKDCECREVWREGKVGVMEKGTRLMDVTLVAYNRETKALCLHVVTYGVENIYAINLFENEIDAYFGEDTALNALEKECSDLKKNLVSKWTDVLDCVKILLGFGSIGFLSSALVTLFMDNMRRYTGTLAVIGAGFTALLCFVWFLGAHFVKRKRTLIDLKEREINERASSLLIDSNIERIASYDA